MIRIMLFYEPQKVFETFKFIKIAVLGAWKNLWEYGCSVLTIFWDPLEPELWAFPVSYVNAQIPNVEYVEVDGGLQDLGSVSSFSSSIFPSNAVRLMSGNQVLSRVMTMFINVTLLFNFPQVAPLCFMAKGLR